MPRTRIKICGLTRVEDVIAAVDAGADAIGFVFAESPRRVSVEQAAALVAHVPSGVERVGVFVDPSEREVFSAVEECGLSAVQLCGEETPEFCDRMPVQVIKVVRVVEGCTCAQAERYLGHAAAVLLEPKVDGAAGGTGTSFDWAGAGRLPDGMNVIAAGGLDPTNVVECVKTLRPDMVDVSSGVETSPGIKDASLMNAFCEAVRKWDEEANE